MPSNPREHFLRHVLDNLSAHQFTTLMKDHIEEADRVAIAKLRAECEEFLQGKIEEELKPSDIRLTAQS